MKAWPNGPNGCGKYCYMVGLQCFGRQWSQRVREVYDQAQSYPGPDPALPETVRQSQRVKQQQRFQEQLRSICRPYLDSDTPMRILCQRVERFLPELFTFIVEHC